MGFNINATDQKQHLNLSDQAWMCLEDDIFNFYREDTKHNLSGFLNQVFSNFYEQALASISYEVDRLSEQLETIFSLPTLKHLDQETMKIFIKKMIHVLEEEVVEKTSSYPKGEGRKFRINNKNLDILEDSIESRYYNDSVGTYLKALFEEYARKPYHEREVIFFKSYILLIEQAIEKSYLIKLTLENNRKFYIYPYQVVIDKTANYNYLVGYSQEILASGLTKQKKSSFRLSRIADMKVLRSKSGKLSQPLIKSLIEDLNSKGPQFLSGEVIEVKIKLTKSGIKKYKSQINLRPNYTSIEENNIFVFHSTEVQIQYYFFKFGKDATIVSPQYLKNRFKYYYQQALMNYT
ncbi:WYL domain-containing protein [Liberiplasma polymorphum]|uniref:WYL domain-containing protein n=1 Tax=Liberiplasma polymorphum TaxID=3374570 RepID=UPI0037730300